MPSSSSLQRGALGHGHRRGQTRRGVADLFPVLGHPELTCWEPLDWDDERLPGRQRRVDLGRDWPLPGSATSRWVTALAGGACERVMREEAAALDPGDDPALRSFHDEGVRSLETFDLVRRVIATVSAP